MTAVRCPFPPPPTFEARELDMAWSPIGNPRTPVALDVRACLRRTA